MKPIYKIVFFCSVALTILAVAAITMYGLRFGVDFKGGSVLEISFEKIANDKAPTTVELSNLIKAVNGVGEASVSPTENKSFIIRTGAIDETLHQEVLKQILTNYPGAVENRFDSIGPSVGQELRSKSITAIIVLLAAITIYIALVFRKLSRVLSPWAMSGAVIMALLHDVIVPIGVFAILGHYLKVEISAVFVAAILTILGYSVSDSVVVFDRVRENVLRFGSKENFGGLVHKSIMQTLTRSLNTTFTTLLSLIAIYFFGGESVKFFALALIIGIFLGAYSSIFVASPILVWWSRNRR